MTRKKEIMHAAMNYRRKDGFAEVVDFIEGAEWADAHPADRWISVDDELPKEATNVLIFSSGWDEPMIGYYKKWNWQRKTHMFHSYIDNSTWYNITHWMPLPSPPEKGGKNYE